MSTNAGFSAATSPFGTISGLTPKSSSNGTSEQLATAINDSGDTVASDAHSKLVAPSCDYAVTGSVNLSGIVLGKIFTFDTKKIMLTNVTINTAAGAEPTVSMSGVEVESTATDVRTVALSGTLTPRTTVQDPAQAFGNTVNAKCTSLNTTYSVEPHVSMVAGVPVASDCSNAKVEAQATFTDYDDTLTTITGGADFIVTSIFGETAPDLDYISKSATATKFLTLADPTVVGVS